MKNECGLPPHYNSAVVSVTDFNYYKAAWFPPPDEKQNNDHVSLYLHLFQQPERHDVHNYLATESKEVKCKSPECIITALFFFYYSYCTRPINISMHAFLSICCNVEDFVAT